MPITRTPMVDDDGSGTTGTIINNAWKTELYDQVDQLAGGTWSAFVPTWRSVSSPQPAIGNGILEGRQTTIGKTVLIRIHLLPGTTTTFGTGNWTFDLPFPATPITTNFLGAMNAWMLEGGVKFWQAYAALDSASAIYVNTVPNTRLGAGAPWAWKSSDQLHIDGFYERA